MYIPFHPSRMSWYWKDYETLLVVISKCLEEFQEISPLNRKVLSPFGHGTRTFAWQLLLVDVYCLQTWTGSALDHLGTLGHKAFHPHQLLKTQILKNIIMDNKPLQLTHAAIQCNITNSLLVSCYQLKFPG